MRSLSLKTRSYPRVHPEILLVVFPRDGLFEGDTGFVQVAVLDADAGIEAGVDPVADEGLVVDGVVAWFGAGERRRGVRNVFRDDTNI